MEVRSLVQTSRKKRMKRIRNPLNDLLFGFCAHKLSIKSEYFRIPLRILLRFQFRFRFETRVVDENFPIQLMKLGSRAQSFLQFLRPDQTPLLQNTQNCLKSEVLSSQNNSCRKINVERIDTLFGNFAYN